VRIRFIFNDTLWFNASHGEKLFTAIAILLLKNFDSAQGLQTVLSLIFTVRTLGSVLLGFCRRTDGADRAGFGKAINGPMGDNMGEGEQGYDPNEPMWASRTGVKHIC